MGFGDGTGSGAIRLFEDAVEEATSFLDDHPETLRRFDRVADLIRGFETPYGLELLSTTHWVAEREGAENPERAVELVRAWSARKSHLFTAEHITMAWQQLSRKGWLPAPADRASGAPDASASSSECGVDVIEPEPAHRLLVALRCRLGELPGCFGAATGAAQASSSAELSAPSLPRGSQRRRPFCCGEARGWMAGVEPV